MSQRIYEGLGSISKIIQILEESNSKNVLLVTGKKSFILSGAEKALKPLLKRFNITRFEDFEINPTFEDAVRGTLIAKKNNIDTVVSIGGGSVIDIAKIILAFIAPNQNFHAIVTGQDIPKNPKIPHFSIPTTAGTGSESTHFAVVYLNKNKYSIAAPFLLPNSAILDGELIISNSSFQKAVNGLDSLAQAIESHWAKKSTTESRSFSRKAIPYLYKNLPKIVSDNVEKKDYQDFIYNSNLAGRAINISKTTSPHAFSYAFTSQYGIPHGQAVWLTLPKIFRIHLHTIKSNNFDGKHNDQFNYLLHEIIDLMGISKKNLEKNFEDFLSSVGVEYSMEKLGVNTKLKRKEIAENVNQERLKNNPVSFSRDDINEIFNL